jgi:hypothetical protein
MSGGVVSKSAGRSSSGLRHPVCAFDPDLLAAQPVPGTLQDTDLVGDAVDPLDALGVGVDHELAPSGRDNPVRRNPLVLGEEPLGAAQVAGQREDRMRQHWEVDELVEHWTLDDQDVRLLRNETGAGTGPVQGPPPLPIPPQSSSGMAR